MGILDFQLDRKNNNSSIDNMEHSINVISDLETKRYRSMLSRDVDFLDKIFADDMHYMHSNSIADGKDEYIAKISSGRLGYLSISASNVDIRVCGDHALVLGHLCAEVVSDGKPRILDCKFIAVWSFEGEAWRFKAFAPTPVPTAA